jgi:hypothetical protein
MNLKFVILTIGTWFLFMIFAIINAILRNGIYKPIIGDLISIAGVIVVIVAIFTLTSKTF